MRESERKWKEAGAAESLALKSFINDPRKSPFYNTTWDLYTAQSQAKLKKSLNWSLLHEGQFRKKK